MSRYTSRKTSIFIKNLFLGGSWGPNETVLKAKIFKVHTSINHLSELKFSNLYLALIKSYDFPNLSKMLIFAYIWRFIKFERFSVGP